MPPSSVDLIIVLERRPRGALLMVSHHFYLVRSSLRQLLNAGKVNRAESRLALLPHALCLRLYAQHMDGMFKEPLCSYFTLK